MGTSTIPIVFASVGDPVGAGLINSLNRPGGNVTGVTSEASDVVGKRLQLFDELLPGKRTVAVLMNPDTPFSALALRELKTAAVAAEQPIQVFEARSADQVLAGVEAAAKAGAAGLCLPFTAACLHGWPARVRASSTFSNSLTRSSNKGVFCCAAWRFSGLLRFLHRDWDSGIFSLTEKSVKKLVK
jgi:hypothetical protein